MESDRGEATTPSTTSIRFNQCKCLKQERSDVGLLRDPTAFERRRSLHMSSRVHAKGVQPRPEAQVAKVIKQEKDSATSSKKVRRTKTDSLNTLVRKELQHCRGSHETYKGLIDILRKPEYLVACYEEIRGKKGNMTRGTTKETLDGLT